MALKDWKRWVVFILWLGALFISLRAHTPWRDEYQSWLVSTRTPTAKQFFEAIRYERHPPLHYVLQRSVTWVFPSTLKLPPKIAIEVITVPFAVGSAAILMFGVGLPLAPASLLIFGPYFFREFSLLSRSYTLGLFFLLAAAAFGQRKRFSLAYGMLALGALTHLLFTWVCGAIFVLLALQDRRWLKDINFWLTGLIMIGAGFLQLPPADSAFSSKPDLSPWNFFVTIRYLNQSLWGLEKIWASYAWNTMPLATDLSAILLIPAIWLVHRAVDLRKFFWICLPPLFLVTVASSMNTRSLGVAFFGFIACFLLFAKDRESRSVHTVTVFAATAVLSTALWWLSWEPWSKAPKFNFSGAREMSETVGSRLRDGILLIEHDAPFFGWMAEANSHAFDVRRGREVHYPYFRKSDYAFADANDWCSQNLREFKSRNAGKPIYFGARKSDSFPKDCGKNEKIFASSQNILTDEKFEIYRLLD